MAKYSKEKIKEWADWVRNNGLIDYGGARLRDFCNYAGIDYQTYYRWLENAEFAEAIKKAKEEYRDLLEQDIVKSLSNVAKGYELTQSTTEYGYDKKGNLYKKKHTTKTMREPANVGAAIFLLTNIAPGRWKNRQSQEVTGKDGKDLLAGAKLIAGMGKDEIAELLSDECCKVHSRSSAGRSA